LTLFAPKGVVELPPTSTSTSSIDIFCFCLPLAPPLFLDFFGCVDLGGVVLEFARFLLSVSSKSQIGHPAGNHGAGVAP